ncbi:hypothetical protein ACFYVC_39990 [Streptomyces tendae]|uniref:hypothetical protein n=1 Tax=Streptomyces tendae TaxID=1932 RepID=UPI0036CB8321
MATKDFAEGAVQRMKDFRAELDNLARRGPSKDLLRQIIGMAPEQGAQLADTLASSIKDSLKPLNTLQSQISKESTALGKTSADVPYDARKTRPAPFKTAVSSTRCRRTAATAISPAAPASYGPPSN